MFLCWLKDACCAHAVFLIPLYQLNQAAPHQRWKVVQYIYSISLLMYNCEVLQLSLPISYFYISEGKIVLFFTPLNVFDSDGYSLQFQIKIGKTTTVV